MTTCKVGEAGDWLSVKSPYAQSKRNSRPDSALLEHLKLPPDGDLFRSRDEVIAAALTRQAQRVAYVVEMPGGEGAVYEAAR